MSCSKWSYTPERCDGDSCVGDCDCCHKSEIDEHNENMMTYNEIIDRLEMMDFFADRAGKELWFDKPTDIQNQDIAKHHQILQSAIQTLKEQRVNKWISVKDGLPKDNETVNITWINRKPVSYYTDIKDKPFTATGVYYKGNWYWWSATIQDCLDEYDVFEPDKIDESIEIVAWMPLPKPYNERKMDIQLKGEQDSI